MNAGDRALVRIPSRPDDGWDVYKEGWVTLYDFPGGLGFYGPRRVHLFVDEVEIISTAPPEWAGR